MAKLVGTNVSNLMPGTAGDDLIFGLAGNDTLQGGAGADWLNGGSGADKLAGSEGDDVYVIDSLADSVIEDAAGGIDRIETALQLTDAALFAEVENFTFTGSKAVTFTGSNAGNRIAGTAANDALSGLIGDDTLIGGAGNDLLLASWGNDSLLGGAGSDTIAGDFGDDTIIGGAGADVILYGMVFHGHDLIAGFDGNAAAGQDILDLDALFDSLGLAAADRAARVQIIDKGSVVELRVDTQGDQNFDLFVATIRTPDAITVGEDVLVGS
jgi:Ca2+-binding RTX toxin-like protein